MKCVSITYSYTRDIFLLGLRNHMLVGAVLPGADYEVSERHYHTQSRQGRVLGKKAHDCH